MGEHSDTAPGCLLSTEELRLVEDREETGAYAGVLQSVDGLRQVSR